VVVALLAAIAARTLGRAPALIAGLIAALYPPLVTIGVAMLSEPLFTAAVLGAVLATLQARAAPRRLGWALVAGGLVGIAALARTNGIIVLPALIAGLMAGSPCRIRSWRGPAAAALAALVVVAPWCVRQAIVFDRPVAISTQDGFTLAGTYNAVSASDPVYPAAWRVPLMAPYDRLLARGGNEAELDGEFRAAALRYIGRHPSYLLRVGYEDLRRLVDLPGLAFEHRAARESGISPGVSDLDVISFYGLGLLAVGGLIRGAARRMPAFVWATAGLMALSLVFIITSMRYRLPIDPFLILLAAGGVAGGRRALAAA
jgi:hypothetical protein